jgi:cytochrome aa3-600 menaquinol oxidase subunit II
MPKKLGTILTTNHKFFMFKNLQIKTKGNFKVRKWIRYGSKFSILGVLVTMLLAACDRSDFLVLDPKGPVAHEEMRLIIISTILCAVIIIPVLVIFVYILVRYRNRPGNNAPYEPEWDDSKVLEVIWWGIPIAIVAILGYYTARTAIDVSKPPVKDVKPVVVQVTSLDWKWLFTYPGQKVATVNYAEIPAGVPIQFVLTSDAPMNSFWVPQLAGQEYTMPGMAMGLWLEANKTGNYYGSGASFTGTGFAHMKFRVRAVRQADFNRWAARLRKNYPALTRNGYEELTRPNSVKEMSFSSYPKGLFEDIVNKNGGDYFHHKHHMGDDMPMQKTRTH